jgi:glycosyltransferase involved in cell wall biosynthesis
VTWLLFAYWYEPEAPSDPVGLVRIWQLGRHLADLGDTVTILAPNYASTRRQRDLRIAGIPLLPVPLLRPLSYVIGSWLAGLAFALRRTPDVVYYRWMDSPHPLVLARLLGRQCVCEVNGEPVPDWDTARSGALTRVKHWLARQTLRRCDRVVVLTEGLRDLVVQRYGVAPGATIILPSATDTERFHPEHPREARRRLWLDPEGAYIGFVGSFYRYQGLTCLLEAFATLRGRRPATRLLLVGDGEAAPSLREQAIRLNVAEAIIWTGRVPYERVPDFINAMDVCVAPFRGDRGETSPVKVFDYLACGRPTVVSAIPSVASLFSEGDGVVLVPPDDPVALTGALNRVLEDPRWADELGRRGRGVACARFGWARVAEQLRDWVGKGQGASAHADSCVL